jgi:hypothetical protein
MSTWKRELTAADSPTVEDSLPVMLIGSQLVGSSLKTGRSSVTSICGAAAGSLPGSSAADPRRRSPLAADRAPAAGENENPVQAASDPQQNLDIAASGIVENVVTSCCALSTLRSATRGTADAHA